MSPDITSAASLQEKETHPNDHWLRFESIWSVQLCPDQESTGHQALGDQGNILLLWGLVKFPTF